MYIRVLLLSLLFFGLPFQVHGQPPTHQPPPTTQPDQLWKPICTFLYPTWKGSFSISATRQLAPFVEIRYFIKRPGVHFRAHLAYFAPGPQHGVHTEFSGDKLSFFGFLRAREQPRIYLKQSQRFLGGIVHVSLHQPLTWARGRPNQLGFRFNTRKPNPLYTYFRPNKQGLLWLPCDQLTHHPGSPSNPPSRFKQHHNRPKNKRQRRGQVNHPKRPSLRPVLLSSSHPIPISGRPNQPPQGFLEKPTPIFAHLQRRTRHWIQIRLNYEWYVIQGWLPKRAAKLTLLPRPPKASRPRQGRHKTSTHTTHHLSPSTLVGSSRTLHRQKMLKRPKHTSCQEQIPLSVEQKGKVYRVGLLQEGRRFRILKRNPTWTQIRFVNSTRYISLRYRSKWLIPTRRLPLLCRFQYDLPPAPNASP